MNPWDVQITKDQWANFLRHDFANGSRQLAFKEIDAERKKIDHVPTVLEIGFGQAFDYAVFFKRLQEAGEIEYTGSDITEQFVQYANETYGPHFVVGNFQGIAGQFDITYTRHTFEHQSPEQWQKDLACMLAATTRMAVITWFIPPAKEARYHWAENQWLGQGAWVNQYAEADVMGVIAKAGFWAMSIPSEQNNKVYVCRRRVQ